MFCNKPFLSSLSIILGILIAGSPLLAFAQEYHPPKRGLPGRREGAGTRGTCMSGQKFLMPITPTDGFSATTSNSPTFFWYVPQTSVQTAEFALLDGSDKQLYKATVNLPGTAGIVSFTLPEKVATSVLENGKDFYWQFAVLCDPNQPSLNPFVEGVVQRVKPNANLINQLKQASSAHDRAAIYASTGIWQDAISTLAQQRCTHPNDASFTASWTKLLQSVRLDEFATEPLITACPATSSSSPRSLTH
jgi:hypothetical protein